MKKYWNQFSRRMRDRVSREDIRYIVSKEGYIEEDGTVREEKRIRTYETENGAYKELEALYRLGHTCFFISRYRFELIADGIHDWVYDEEYGNVYYESEE